MNFSFDFEKIILENLIDIGFKDAEKLSPIKQFSMLFDNQERKVIQKRYKVKLSAELKEKQENSSFSNVLNEVISRFKIGKPITPYQSTNINFINTLDGLLLHWGINHLHLEGISTLNENGFVKRADYLLFFRVDRSTIYLINVLPHPHGRIEWARSDLVRTADRNWPHLHILLKGVCLEREITDEDYANLRKSNILTFIETDRGIIIPSAGVNSSGHSNDSIKMWDTMHHRLKNLETVVRKHYESMFRNTKGYVTRVSLIATTEDGFVIRDAAAKKEIIIPNRYL